MKALLTLVLCLVAIVAAGCGHSSEVELPLHGIRGTRYMTSQELLVTGIKNELSSTRHDFVKLFPYPGIDGPEVVHLGTLPAGSVLEIVGLVQQGPKWMSHEMYRVKVHGSEATRFLKEDVRLASWDTFYAGSDDHGQPILSPVFFRKL